MVISCRPNLISMDTLNLHIRLRYVLLIVGVLPDGNNIDSFSFISNG